MRRQPFVTAGAMHRGTNYGRVGPLAIIFTAANRCGPRAIFSSRLEGLIFVLIAALLLAAVPAGAKNRPVKASAEEIRLTGTLQERLDAVNARAKELDQRQDDLDALQKDLDEKLQRLTALQTDVQQKLEELKAIKDNRFKKLVKVYSAMSASKLAPLLDKMKDDTVAEVLRAMKPDDVAKILPKMEKDKAVRVSRIMGLVK